MTDPLRPLPPRRGGSTLVVAVDLLRQSMARRNWLPILVVLLAALAAALVVASQSAVPWAIYPAL